MLLLFQQNLIAGLIGLTGQSVAVGQNALTVATPKVSTFKDDFNDGVLAPFWTFDNQYAFNATGGVYVESGGNAAPQSQFGSATDVAEIYSNAAYDLTSSELVVRIASVGQADTFGTWLGGIELRAFTDTTPQTQRANYLSLELSRSPTQDTLTSYAGDATVVELSSTSGPAGDTATSFNQSRDVWWKISESGGTITWWTAPDAAGSPGTWASRATYLVSNLSFSITQLRVILYNRIVTSISNITADLAALAFDVVNPQAAAPITAALTTQLLTATRGSVASTNAVGVPVGQQFTALPTPSPLTAVSSEALTTQLVTSQQQTIVATATEALITQLITSQRGSVVATQSVDVPLTTQLVGLTQGNPTTDITRATVGAQFAALQNPVVATEASLISGQQIAATTGSMAGVASGTLTGASITAQPGQIQEADAIMPSGMQIAASQGSVAAVSTTSVTTQAVSFAQTAPLAQILTEQLLTGSSASSAPGSVAPGSTTAVNGQSTSTTQGLISGGVAYPVTGVVTSTQQGTAVPNASTGVTGSNATLVQQSIANATLVSLSGSSTQVLAGLVADSDTILLDSIVLSVSSGVSGPVISAGLVGAQINGAQGDASNKIILDGLTLALSQTNTSPFLNVSQGGTVLGTTQGSVSAVTSKSVALTGASAAFEQTTTNFEQWSQLSGTTILDATGLITANGGVAVIVDASGGYGNYGVDIRTDLAARHAKRQKEEWMELALQEDQLLLATIRSTLENPKYGF